MKTDRQKHNWMIDAGLFAGLLGAMWVDLTGAALHQWLGLAVIGLSAYHLVTHWEWVKSVTNRLCGRLSGQTRSYYVIDAAMMAGMLVTGGTGLAMSTWLNLPLSDFAAWSAVHLYAALATLALTVIKIAAHWRWIVTVAKRRVFAAPTPAAAAAAAPAAGAPAKIGRRDFVVLMSAAGGSALLVGLGALKGIGGGQAPQTASAAPAASSTPSAAATSVAVTTATPAATATSTDSATANTTADSAATSCVVLCNRHCSYPGHCRRYVDSNNDRLCDRGQCSA